MTPVEVQNVEPVKPIEVRNMEPVTPIEFHNVEPVTPVEVHNVEPVTSLEIHNLEPVTPIEVPMWFQCGSNAVTSIEDRIARVFELKHFISKNLNFNTFYMISEPN